MSSEFRPQITVDSRGSKLIILRKGDQVPAFIHGLVRYPGIAPENIRLAVGCKKIPPEIARDFIPTVLEALKVYDNGKVVRTTRGSFWSGGTANADKTGTLLDDMPTVLPGHIAAAYPTIAFSTTPKRFDTLAQNYVNGGLIIDEYGTRIDFRHHHLNLVYEPDIFVPAPDWDFDVELYKKLQDEWDKVGIRTGVLGANGGPVALLEYVLAMQQARRLILVKGSLREADAVIAALEDGNYDLVGKEERDGYIAKRDKDGASAQVKEQMTAKIEVHDKKIEGFRKIIAASCRDVIRVVPINNSRALNQAFLDLGFLQPFEEGSDEDPNA